MKRLFKFLANRKGSAFIETLMVYVCVALMGTAVVGVATKTIKDAAAGSPYQEELITNDGNSDDNTQNYIEFSLVFDSAYSYYASERGVTINEGTEYKISVVEGTTWEEFINSEQNIFGFYIYNLGEDYIMGIHDSPVMYGSPYISPYSVIEAKVYNVEM